MQLVVKWVLFIFSYGGMNILVVGQYIVVDSVICVVGLQNVMQGFDYYCVMLQEGVVVSQVDLVVIFVDGFKGMGGEVGLWKLFGLVQILVGCYKQLLMIDDMVLLGFGLCILQVIIVL